MDNKITYHEQNDIDNTLKLREVLKTLPPFCRDYFRAIDATTTTKTRISYAYDIRIFFQFLLDQNPMFKDKNMSDFTVDVLDQIKAVDLEEYEEFLKVYKSADSSKTETNGERGVKRALSVVFFCLSTVTNSVLQGLDDMMTPVKNAAISLVIHIVTLFLMLVVLKWNIYAVVLSKIIFSGAICILNAKALRDRIGYVQEKKKTFLIPTLASLIMGVIAIVIHLIFELFAGPYIATIIALLAAVAAYGVSIVALGGITEEELLGMPKGAALVTICRRLHLIRGEYK